jgi:hypothetical protein
MSSITGLKRGAFTSIDNSGEIRLGAEIDPGTAGQALVSGGPDQPAVWDTHTGIIQPLTAGANITYASGNPSFNGSVADTIIATDTNTEYTAGNGMDLTGTTFSTDNDGTTINNTGGTGTQNQVLKVPNSLTQGSNITFSSGTTYDGSAAITISSTDTDTTYQAGNGIEINTATNPDTISAKPDEDTIDFDGDELAVLKVPEGLSAGTNLSYTSGSTFDGAAARTINLDTNLTNVNLTDSTNIIHPPNVFDYAGDLRMSIEMGNFYPNDDSSYFNIGVEDDLSAKIHGTLKVLTSSLEVCGYFIIPNNYTATALRIDVTNSSGSSVSRTITAASVITYGATGFTSLVTTTTNAEQALVTTMAGASDRIMLIKIFTTSTSDHIRGGYIKLTR